MLNSHGDVTSPSRCGRYVGRVGALAVALGVGLAVSTGLGSGVALADDTGASQNDEPGAQTEPSGTQAETNDPPSQPDPLGAEQESANGTDNATRESKPASVPRMIFNSSGGALTSERWQRRPALRWRDGLQPSNEPSTQPSTDVGTPDSPKPTGPTSSRHGANQYVSAPQAQTLEATTQPPTRAPRIPAPVKRQPPPVLSAQIETHAVDIAAGQQKSSPAALNVGILHDPAQRRAPEPPAVTAPALTAPTAVLTVATNLLSAAHSPFATPRPAAPAQPPVLLAVLGWVRREIEHTFFNKTPNIRDQEIEVHRRSGEVFQFDVDTDDDPLTYSVPDRGQPGGPTKGTVTIDQATGSYTYTPDPGTPAGETDTFTVTVSDAGDGFHLHGLSGFRLPDGGHTDTATVHVTIVNDPPVTPSRTYNVRVGEATVVDLLQIASDPNGDPLTRGTLVYKDESITVTILPEGVVNSVLQTQYLKVAYPVAGNMTYSEVTVKKPGTATLTYTMSDGVSQSTGVLTFIATDPAAVVT